MNNSSAKLLAYLSEDMPHELTEIKDLLDKGADINSEDDAGNTPLLLELSTCFTRGPEIAQFLCQNGSDIHHRNNRGQSALMLSARKAPNIIIQGLYPRPMNEFSAWLIKNGVDLGAVDADGNSAIHYAYGNKKILELLIKSGLSIHHTNKNNQTLLHVPTAVYLETDFQHKLLYGGIPTTVLKWILKQDLDPNARDTNGYTSLHAVSRINSYNPIIPAEVLITAGADPCVLDAKGISLVDFHISEGNLKLAKWISKLNSGESNKKVIVTNSTDQPMGNLADTTKSQSSQVKFAKAGDAATGEEVNSLDSTNTAVTSSQTLIDKQGEPILKENKTKENYSTDNGATHNGAKITKEILEQKQRIAEASKILEPILNDLNVRESTKNRIRFVFDVEQPTYWYSLRETGLSEISRHGNMFGGWPFTSDKYPWPRHEGRPLPPFIQLNLSDVSRLSRTDLGDGLLQIWANHHISTIRVIKRPDIETAPTAEYYQTGILGLGEEDSRFDTSEFNIMPHARRNGLIRFSRPKPTIIPYFEVNSGYSNLDDEDLGDDHHALLSRARKLVKKYFPSFHQSYLFGAHDFLQCGYGFYIDLCITEGWRPLMSFDSDGHDLEFGYDGRGYLLYRIIGSTTEFFFYWDR